MRIVGSVSAVTLGTLLHVVSELHGVPRDRLPALKGRFINFLKIPFPEVTTAGTGRRTEFWPEHVAHVLIAFELIRFRVPQSACARAVLESAGVVEGAVGDAARLLAGSRGDDSILLEVRSNALLDDAKKPELSDVSLVRVGSPESVERGRQASVWTIDVVRLISNAIEAAASGDEPLDAGFFVRLNDRTRA